MKKFKCDVEETPTEIIWKLSGEFDEHASLGQIDKSKALVINFKRVSLVNSYGIRIWSKWMNEHKDFSNLFFDECPFVFVKNFGVISGFISNNAVVRSFFVPFINENTEERKDVLFHLGDDYEINGFLRIPDVKDSNGEYMELDVNPTKYFSFLKRK